MKKSILVTGTNSGFGKLIVDTLAKDGHQIFATMRNINGKNADAAAYFTTLAKEENLDIHVIDMDISEDHSVAEAIKQVFATTDNLDVVVNNAGFAYVGINEAFSSSDVADTFNGNIIGPMRVNNAVLPVMRRQQNGLLVQITSASAHNHLPFMSVYSAAKSAMDIIAEGYNLELKKLGVDSCMIEPGGFPTEGMSKARNPQNVTMTNEYGVVAEVMQKYFSEMEERSAKYPEQDPQVIADAVKALIDTPQGQRPLRQVVGDVMTEQAKKINQFAEPLQTEFFKKWGVSELLD